MVLVATRLHHRFSNGPVLLECGAASSAFPNGLRVAIPPFQLEQLPRPHDLRSAPAAPARADREDPFTRRYRVTDDGLRTALCYHRTYARVLRPAMSVVFDAPPGSASRLNRAVDSFDSEIQRLWEGRQLAA